MRSIPTALIQLSPNFLAQLKKIAPRKKRSKLWYIVLFAVPAIIAFVVAHRPTRTFVVGKARAAYARIAAPPAAPPTVIVAPIAEPSATPVPSESVSAAPSAVAFVAPSASVAASVSASASVKPPSKPWVKRRK